MFFKWFFTKLKGSSRLSLSSLGLIEAKNEEKVKEILFPFTRSNTWGEGYRWWGEEAEMRCGGRGGTEQG